MKTPRTLRQVFPVWLGLVVGLLWIVFLSYYLFLGGYFSLAVTFVFFLLGVLIGSVFAYIFRSEWDRIPYSGKLKLGFRMTIVMTVLAAVGIYGTQMLIIEHNRRPRVLENTDIVSIPYRQNVPSTAKGVCESCHLDSSERNTVSLNQRVVKFDVFLYGVRMYYDGLNPFAALDLNRYGSISHVDAISFRMGSDSSESLAVLATMNYHSHRSVLNIFDSAGNCLFQELLHRSGDDHGMTTVAEEGYGLCLLVDVGRQLIYRRRGDD